MSKQSDAKHKPNILDNHRVWIDHVVLFLQKPFTSLLLLIPTICFLPFSSVLANSAAWQTTRHALPGRAVALETGVSTRVSVASDGSQGNGSCYGTSLSADGRFVSFTSSAENLVSDDTNLVEDVFVHDRHTGQTERVSVANDGYQGNGPSWAGSISGDGRFVAFASWSENLVNDDTNDVPDVFVRDRQTGQTTRVSVASNGMQGDWDSSIPAISADGRFVAFSSAASNLVSEDTNEEWDIFVHDRLTGQTARVSVASDGTQTDSLSSNPSISADGRFVAFDSYASNLVVGDTNGWSDIFVHDRLTGQTTLVSRSSNGAQGDGWSEVPSISADGRFLAFMSMATNFAENDSNQWLDIFVRDRETGQTERVSVASDSAQANFNSRYPAISSNGRFVAFDSDASNLVIDDTNAVFDVFVHDRLTRRTARVSIASDGTQGDRESAGPSISADGGLVAFQSAATNLVSGDTNNVFDIFAYEREFVTIIYLPVVQR